MTRLGIFLFFLVFTTSHTSRAEIITLSGAAAMLGQYLAAEAMASVAASECRAVPAGQWRRRGDPGQTLVWAGPDDARSMMEQAEKYRAARQDISEQLLSKFPQVSHEIEEGLRRNGGVEAMVERMRTESQSDRDRLGELGWCTVQKASIDYIGFNVLRSLPANPTIVAD